MNNQNNQVYNILMEILNCTSLFWCSGDTSTPPLKLNSRYEIEAGKLKIRIGDSVGM